MIDFKNPELTGAQFDDKEKEKKYRQIVARWIDLQALQSIFDRNENVLLGGTNISHFVEPLVMELRRLQTTRELPYDEAYINVWLPKFENQMLKTRIKKAPLKQTDPAYWSQPNYDFVVDEFLRKNLEKRIKQYQTMAEHPGLDQSTKKHIEEKITRFESELQRIENGVNLIKD